MHARIYKPAKTAMSSGRGQTKDWILEFSPSQQRVVDPLMGWTGSGDMTSQVRLEFDSQKSAEAYARKHGLAFEIIEDTPRGVNIRPKGYSENFAHARRSNWTH